jgi:hypothetical protein
VLAHIPIHLIRRTGRTNYYAVVNSPHSIGIGSAQHWLLREKAGGLGVWLNFGYPLDYYTVLIGREKAWLCAWTDAHTVSVLRTCCLRRFIAEYQMLYITIERSYNDSRCRFAKLMISRGPVGSSGPRVGLFPGAAAYHSSMLSSH